MKTNDPPSYKIRPRLIANFKMLKDAFQRIAAGRSFTASLEEQEKALPEEVKA